jgi:DNA-binding response OmpR family regulator
MLPTTHGEQPFRILLVERSEETRDLFAALFLAMGYEVRTVTTGTEALAWVPVFRPHAVFSAIRLPDQSGFDLCMALRRMPETARALIVAITGFLSPDAAARAVEAGFDRYLVKPVKLDTILATLHAIHRSEDANTAPTETSSSDNQTAH